MRDLRKIQLFKVILAMVWMVSSKMTGDRIQESDTHGLGYGGGRGTRESRKVQILLNAESAGLATFLRVRVRQ
jgi:hypothetical protein